MIREKIGSMGDVKAEPRPEGPGAGEPAPGETHQAGGPRWRWSDWIVPWSFGRFGYEHRARRFDPADLSLDLGGRTILVTGASSGLGLAATRALARRGATVVMLCRDLEKGAAARGEILRAVPEATLRLESLDLSSLASVRAFLERFEPPTVDVLINNAGVMPNARVLTEDGLELTWATNVVGPFALTHGLLPKLTRGGRGRVITVSSGGMYLEPLSLRDLDWSRRRFDGVRAYAQTKRAEVVLNELWAERAPELDFHAMHPGWADTPGVRGSLPRFHRITRALLRSPEQGADTMVWLAAAPSLGAPSGSFWLDRRPVPTELRSSRSPGPEERAALWDLVAAQSRALTQRSPVNMKPSTMYGNATVTSSPVR